MPVINSAAIVGIEAVPISIETDIAFGMGAFNIVGLPDTAIKEARDRIRAAIRNSGFSFPRTRITVNLAPADIRKQGALYDLPIALAILLSQGEFNQMAVAGNLFIGELSLDGTVRAIPGALSMAVMARKLDIKNIFLPESNIAEVFCVKGLKFFAVSNLKQVVEHLKEINKMEPTQKINNPHKPPQYQIDFQDIKGQHLAKRGLEIAAAGSHNILLKGPPGTGKTLLARALPSILPPLTYEEALETTAIASVVGHLLPNSGLMRERPFRHPHHSSSAISLVGGGTWPKPGEVSLSHRGVLFLDELPEFPRCLLEHLRQPLEDGEVVISRAAASIRFPARFLLVAAMNPCPCGYATDPKHPCVCSAKSIERYSKRISGPLLDRFDMIVEVPNLEVEDIFQKVNMENSEAIRKRVVIAREKQKKRFLKTSFITNAEISQAKIVQWCLMEEAAQKLLKQALANNQLSMRGYARVQKVARTIADLENTETILEKHVAEALLFREQKTAL